MAKRKNKTTRAVHNRPKYQVFVSHSGADKWLAVTLCEKIEATGATTFRDDRDIAGGDDIPDEIRRQIKQSREVVVLVTPHSWDRQWVLIEIGGAWAWSKKMRIVPIRYHVEVDRVPEIIRQKNAYTLNDVDKYLKELGKRVKESGR
ncbi:MAG: toll/interleukin-1 receptor domain-containing protein [Phycisphaerales bacterium]